MQEYAASATTVVTDPETFPTLTVAFLVAANIWAKLELRTSRTAERADR
jgi:hypothetical protein